jgi:predicted nucleic acid-binding protein
VIIVSDTSPINNLAAINHLHLLQQLYTGILGILVEAKSQRLISAVKPLLDALINQAGFWVAEPLYKRVLQLVDEDDTI